MIQTDGHIHFDGAFFPIVSKVCKSLNLMSLITIFSSQIYAALFEQRSSSDGSYLTAKQSLTWLEID